MAYSEDPTVPKGSLTPTFAAAVMKIKNSRWDGVPFILKCGKGLNERKAEIRIHFKHVPGALYSEAPFNELVLRVQPNEAIYMKLLTKSPGLGSGIEQVELDLSYQQRFRVGNLPDAYERLILDATRGNHSLFVRNDELEVAWRIFTPLLHKLEREKVKPTIYPFGSRGPKEADELVHKTGVKRNEGYQWSKI